MAPVTVHPSDKQVALSIQLHQFKWDIPLKKEPKVVHSNSTVKAYVQAFFKDAPILIQVARCESQFRMWEADGSVFKGRITPADKGPMQINAFYHESEAKRLGYSIYTLEGNLGYAKYLYKTQGLQPWEASKGCWSKQEGSVAVAYGN